MRLIKDQPRRGDFRLDLTKEELHDLLCGVLSDHERYCPSNDCRHDEYIAILDVDGEWS